MDENVICRHIHGYPSSDSDFDSSISGKSDFDEEYYRLKPPPTSVENVEAIKVAAFQKVAYKKVRKPVALRLPGSQNNRYKQFLYKGSDNDPILKYVNNGNLKKNNKNQATSSKLSIPSCANSESKQLVCETKANQVKRTVTKYKTVAHESAKNNKKDRPANKRVQKGSNVNRSRRNNSKSISNDFKSHVLNRMKMKTEDTQTCHTDNIPCRDFKPIIFNRISPKTLNNENPIVLDKTTAFLNVLNENSKQIHITESTIIKSEGETSLTHNNEQYVIPSNINTNWNMSLGNCDVDRTYEEGKLSQKTLRLSDSSPSVNAISSNHWTSQNWDRPKKYCESHTNKSHKSIRSGGKSSSVTTSAVPIRNQNLVSYSEELLDTDNSTLQTTYFWGGTHKQESDNDITGSVIASDNNIWDSDQNKNDGKPFKSSKSNMVSGYNTTSNNKSINIKDSTNNSMTTSSATKTKNSKYKKPENKKISSYDLINTSNFRQTNKWQQLSGETRSNQYHTRDIYNTSAEVIPVQNNKYAQKSAAHHRNIEALNQTKHMNQNKAQKVCHTATSKNNINWHTSKKSGKNTKKNNARVSDYGITSLDFVQTTARGGSGTAIKEPDNTVKYKHLKDMQDMSYTVTTSKPIELDHVIFQMNGLAM